MKLSKALSALPYAHLLGVSAKAESEDQMKQGAEESDEDYAKRMEEEDEDKKESKPEQEEEDKDNDGMKSKSKAKSEENDEGDGADEDEDKKDNAKAARESERARCKAIFACESAGIRPDVAAHLAFETDMSSADAVAMLKTVASGVKASGLASRMSLVKLPNVGSGADAQAPGLTVAQQIIAAGKKRRGEI